MKVQVWLAKENFIRDSFFYQKFGSICSKLNIISAFMDRYCRYTKVAVIEVADLNEAYAKTQNLDKPWNDIRCRSVSVGDLFKIEGEDPHLYHIVASTGFDPVRMVWLN